MQLEKAETLAIRSPHSSQCEEARKQLAEELDGRDLEKVTPLHSVCRL